LVDFASGSCAGAPTLRGAIAVCGAVPCPQAVLVRSVAAALADSRCVDDMRAGTWALGGPVEVVRKALRKGGAGFWVFGGGVGAEQVAMALEEAAEIVRDLLVVIFNTIVATEATARGANGDCGSRQPGLDAGCLARLGLVPGLRAGLAAMDGMCSALARMFSAPYFSNAPVLLFLNPGAAQQLAHTNAAPVSLDGAGAPRLLGGLRAFQEDTRLILCPRLQLITVESEGGTSMGAEAGIARGRRTGGAKRGGRVWGRVGRKRGKGRAQVMARVADNEGTCAGTEEDFFVLRVPVGFLSVCRGDAVHAGAGIPSQTPHWRMHVYLLCEGFSELGLLDETTIVAWKRSVSSRPRNSCSLRAPPHTPTHIPQLPCPRLPPSCQRRRGGANVQPPSHQRPRSGPRPPRRQRRRHPRPRTRPTPPPLLLLPPPAPPPTQPTSPPPPNPPPMTRLPAAGARGLGQSGRRRSRGCRRRRRPGVAQPVP